jgi:hypothetical protein
MVKMLGIEDDFEIHTFKTRDDAKLHTVLAQPGDLTAKTDEPKRLINAEAELFRRRFKRNVAEYNAGEGSPRARRDFTDHIDEYLERWDTFALNDQAEAFKVETKIDILADPLDEAGKHVPVEAPWTDKTQRLSPSPSERRRRTHGIRLGEPPHLPTVHLRVSRRSQLLTPINTAFINRQTTVRHSRTST